MRDKIKDKKYFHEYIEEEEENSGFFALKLNNNEIREDRIFSVQKEINSIRFRLFIAKYSEGEDLDKIKAEFLGVVKKLPQFWNPTTAYINIIWILSIAIMYEVESKYWNILVELVKESNLDDWLIEYLMSYGKNSTDYENVGFRMENPYKFIKDIVCKEEDKILRIKSYLTDKWYDAHNEMDWYDTHKHKEKLYCGYWSFEAGAIAKILNLDDSKLKDEKYYPYDLVHYK